MMYAQSIRERIDASLRGERFPTAVPEACWWAGRRALGNLNVDLEHDKCQEVARKFERWELVEAYGNLRKIGCLPVLERGGDLWAS
jgi:hypothetical protein